MSTSPSSAAEVRDPVLQEGYRRCAELTREYGTTYFWGAALLPRSRRRHVYAVYALCRLADDIVDVPDDADRDVAELTSRLAAFAGSFRTALADGGSDDPVLAAVAQTVRAVEIEPECFDRFFGAMAMDLTTTSYRTWDDLLGYMEGSAAVIGEMMLPVLDPIAPAARQPARSLGLAFQLTNFLRDVGEDLGYGRVYVPQEDLERFGADPAERRVTPEWRALMAFEVARNRQLYRAADAGIPLLPPRSARCVATARVLYARILDLIEQADGDVFGERLRVPTWRKAGMAARIFVGGPSGAQARPGPAVAGPAGVDREVA
ncbi:phytoene/squalene synthase family protein [Nakamurella leprariae]|uniref:Phytoene/squalene synthase family protein n=1 Tax=Nakamurella leprariae TaxID=2803911 RepID=A0A938YEA6_9ACTN|nr:phytoene/squalene synthase family protein [Nakamurella leprariae]MBM9467976.1 phytoene/squalene synthase family protein [Nakamurella leprariae]